MRRATTFAPNLQVLRFSMIEYSRFESILEHYYFRPVLPHEVQERTFDQVTHLILRYTDINPGHAVRHPLPFVGVPCLIHLEILLSYLHSIHNLLTFDYPTVTRLTVTMLAHPAPAVMNTTKDPADVQSLLDLMKRLPNLKNADLTVPSVIMASLRAELGRNPPTSVTLIHNPHP
jgi:hypothetical protein